MWFIASLSNTENLAPPVVMRVKQQLKLVLFVEVEQKLEQGLCAIGNHVPLVVMRVEHRMELGLLVLTATMISHGLF